MQDSCPDNFASEGAADMQLSLTAATVTISRTVSLQFPHGVLFQEKKSGETKKTKSTSTGSRELNVPLRLCDFIS